MLKTVYDANVAIENYDFKKLVEVENQTIQILSIGDCANIPKTRKIKIFLD